jgi:threonyl-tRNA synthetase
MNLETLRHSCAHLLAQAVKELFPDVKLGIGPAIENGFYYDFEKEEPFTPEDLKVLEKKMYSLAKKKLQIENVKLTKKEQTAFFKQEPYKKELAKELKELSFYKQGDFIDLCKGPHVENTKELKGIFKLTKVSAAYWKGDSKNNQLQRIYGYAFESKEKLKAYIQMMLEAAKRDHRKLGKKLSLFSFHDEGPGMPFFHPKGMILWNKLIEYWHEEHKKDNYSEIKTPIMLNRILWETSGHWDNYRENMYETNIDEMEFAIKPMNCPGGMLWYKESLHSYKELPMRVGEIGLVHRHELSGVLSGLFRVRAFHQDDAHIFMTEDQIEQEVLGVLNLIDRTYKTFGFEYTLELSTRPEKSIGTDKQWKVATEGLSKALKKWGQKFQVNEGDGAFYGPKIDIHIKDSIGRTWQCGTVQLDMSLPERFDLNYEGSDGKKHRPVMIHRVIYGSMERFLGILIEHFAGKFPLWLSPVQVKVLTVTDRSNKFADQVIKKLKDNNIRVELDDRNETINKKIREAQVEQINYMVVLGDKETDAKTLAVRHRTGKQDFGVKVDAFIKDLLKEIGTKTIK